MNILRWFSFFDSWEFYKSDIFSTKMILEAYMDSHSLGEVLQSDSADNAAPLPQSLQSEDARAELKNMQMQCGSWKTAYMCINAQVAWQTKCLAAVVKPVWMQSTHT